MSSIFLSARVNFILLSCLLATAAGEGYNRERCYRKVQSMLAEGTLASNDTCFYRDDDGTIFSTPESPVLTLDSCIELCGAPFGWYVDIGPRLSTWLIPVFLLLSNMEVSPLDKRRYLMILHLLGDPIDSLWSLLSKLEAWSRCYRLAAEMYDSTERTKIRNMATLLGGFEDLVGFRNDPVDVYTKILSRSTVRGNKLDILISQTAQQLADSRTDERLRTLLATTLYVYQIVSAFVATVGGGNTSPPGGRIGITMFMTWVIPSILLSNAIGGFTSRRTCYSILESFVQDVTAQDVTVQSATARRTAWQILRHAAPSLKHYRSVHEYFDNLAWSGAVYSYRPKKVLVFASGPRDKSPTFLLFLATAPIITSSVIATMILWNTPPIGINCRNILVFVMTSLVFLSALFTQISSSFFNGARHWHIVLVKDALIAIPSVVLIFLACAGLFNSCWCWSGVYSLRAKARVPLNAFPYFVIYNKTTYPALVAVCLTLQCVAFMGMMWVGWRGWNLMRWSEEEKKAEWRRGRRLS
ncbi:hypothetical protein FB567DRAFT_547641 [Paraphoma chrysanthemicola]|uniref:Uncharacterized protein n=1 Tax=Paraphoma chrysanthemicola TaxID=798071 RepID=A0A8K0R9X5_9PLEO|nr:hypothetical protein FB567DRAFT_547641 [Paraphoma chrysanthemicola]